MKDFLNRLLFLNGRIVGVKHRIDRIEKFIKGERINVKEIDHANWIRFWFCKECTEQAARSNDMIVACLLFEVFECVQGFRALLNLVKENERLFWKDFFTGNHGKQFDDTVWIFVCLKDGFEFVLLVKVEINIVFIAVLSKFLHEPGFSHLSCSTHDKRLAILAGFPMD